MCIENQIRWLPKSLRSARQLTFDSEQTGERQSKKDHGCTSIWNSDRSAGVKLGLGVRLALGEVEYLNAIGTIGIRTSAGSGAEFGESGVKKDVLPWRAVTAVARDSGRLIFEEPDR